MGMEAFRPPFAAEIQPDSVERLPFDLLRALVVARQAATPTAHLLAGRGYAQPVEANADDDALLRMMLHSRFAGDEGASHGARFAACSIGRILVSTQEVSA